MDKPARLGMLVSWLLSAWILASLVKLVRLGSVVNWLLYSERYERLDKYEKAPDTILLILLLFITNCVRLDNQVSIGMDHDRLFSYNAIDWIRPLRHQIPYQELG